MASANQVSLLDGVRRRLRPGAAEILLLERVRDSVFERLHKVVPKSVEIGLMGSSAKGTSLKSNLELDIFLMVPTSMSHREMGKKAVAWARKAMRGCKTELSYAQHPYLKAYVGGVKIDIVPCYKIERAEGMGSATDRSQLHVKWVGERIRPAQQDDVRLLKQFLKSLGIYGAQSRVEGFSGYLCELLILHYGSFVKTLEAAGEWKQPVLDPAGHHADPAALRARFAGAAMVLIDPVDPERNVSAVVSHTSLSRFILAARGFLAKPGLSYFFKEKAVHDAKKLRSLIARRQTHTLVLSMPSPDEVEDVLWPQLRKTTHALISVLEQEQFRLLGHYFWADEKDSLILFELIDRELPAILLKKGPQVWHAKDVEAFIRTHEKAGALNFHLEHERIVAVRMRPHRTPKEALEAALRQPGRLGIPAPFARAMKKARWGTALDLLKKAPWREVASDYFTRRL